MPAIAPDLVTLFQNNENSIIGPNVAPKPAHANETIVKILLFSFKANIIAKTAITSKAILVKRKTCLSVASFFIMPQYMFLAKAEAAINKYESDELIVAASMPAITIPANNGKKKLVDIRIKILSDALCVRKASGYSTLPIIPIATAAVREISHQIVAILLEKVSSFVFLIAINFNKTCGMPKYPSPRKV
jgi:hypothetical protein